MLICIREHGSVLYLGMAMEFQFDNSDGISMIQPKQLQNSKPRLEMDLFILPSSSQKYSQTYPRVCGS